jgi:exopolyphosphatase/guanosine-5'-triphosphate,3'-diphosphate pyrophosphatase
MRLATIDIGTNTILMLIADLGADGAIEVIRDEQVIARLGQGVDANRNITAETTERVLRYLRACVKTAESFHTEKIVLCGTSALRDAANSKGFIQHIKEELGLEIEVLSGPDEAELTYRGAVAGHLNTGAQDRLAVLDIGGGSTELTIGRGESITSKASIDLGCVRLTERTLKASPPTSSALEQALSAVRSSVGALPRLPSGARLIGVAGTVTTLAAIDLNLDRYDPQRVEGHQLSIESIERISRELRNQSVAQMIERFPQIQPGRADIILAGVLILTEALKHFQTTRITVSDRGLRYGIAMRELSKRGVTN